jgi:hypothetical protein
VPASIRRGQLRKRLPEGEYRGPQDVLDTLRKER